MCPHFVLIFVFLSPEDKIVAVMGMTGVGKSSFIQLFTHESVGVGDDLESCM